MKMWLVAQPRHHLTSITYILCRIFLKGFPLLFLVFTSNTYPKRSISYQQISCWYLSKISIISLNFKTWACIMLICCDKMGGRYETFPVFDIWYLYYYIIIIIVSRKSTCATLCVISCNSLFFLYRKTFLPAKTSDWELGEWLKWYTVCLASISPRVQTLVPQKKKKNTDCNCKTIVIQIAYMEDIFMKTRRVSLLLLLVLVIWHVTASQFLEDSADKMGGNLSEPMLSKCQWVLLQNHTWVKKNHSKCKTYQWILI
jgi:hypothetical protein